MKPLVKVVVENSRVTNPNPIDRRRSISPSQNDDRKTERVFSFSKRVNRFDLHSTTMMQRTTLKRIIMRRNGLNCLLSCRRAVAPPDAPHVILSNRDVHSKRYHRFSYVRKKLGFRIRDSSFASLLRMYELVLCGLDEELALEAEYFWNRKWRVNKIPDPTHYGWEQDLERDRICQAIVLILAQSFNYHIATSGVKNSRKCARLPKWARNENFMESVDLCQHYLSLGRLYFFLPWKRLWFVHPPCDSRVVNWAWSFFANIYRHHPKLLSLPLFRSKDTYLASFCRFYELDSLCNCLAESRVTGMHQFEELLAAYEKEKEYFFARSERIAEIPDPRERWHRVEIREPDTFKELVEFARQLGKMETERHGGITLLPRWAWTSNEADEITL